MFAFLSANFNNLLLIAFPHNPDVILFAIFSSPLFYYNLFAHIFPWFFHIFFYKSRYLHNFTLFLFVFHCLTFALLVSLRFVTYIFSLWNRSLLNQLTFHISDFHCAFRTFISHKLALAASTTSSATPPTLSFINLHTFVLCRDSFAESANFLLLSFLLMCLVLLSLLLLLLNTPTLQYRISLETCKRLITAEISHAQSTRKWVEWADWRCRQLLPTLRLWLPAFDPGLTTLNLCHAVGH